MIAQRRTWNESNATIRWLWWESWPEKKKVAKSIRKVKRRRGKEMRVQNMKIRHHLVQTQCNLLKNRKQSRKWELRGCWFVLTLKFNFWNLNLAFHLRLKRECEERIKAQRLLMGNSKEQEQPKIEVDDRKRKYNNQFNPDFSKY